MQDILRRDQSCSCDVMILDKEICLSRFLKRQEEVPCAICHLLCLLVVSICTRIWTPPGHSCLDPNDDALTAVADAAAVPSLLSISPLALYAPVRLVRSLPLPTPCKRHSFKTVIHQTLNNALKVAFCLTRPRRRLCSCRSPLYLHSN